METLNTACRRILEAKYKLGLFVTLQSLYPKRPARDIFTKDLVMQLAELQPKALSF